MRALAAVALLALLAGCADDPPAPAASARSAASPPNDPRPDAPERPFEQGPMRWTTLSAGTFMLDVVNGTWGVDVGVPERTQVLLVNLTSLVGPTVELRGEFRSCTWRVGGTFVANGDATGFGCPYPIGGPERLRLLHDAGRLEGQFEVTVYHSAAPMAR